MKRLFTTVLLFFFLSSAAVHAEYQVFTYSATLTRAEATAGGGGSVTKDTLSGYLVTVSCFPCGASFGRGYQSWLLVTSSKLGKTLVWKIPCQVRGGIFGNNCDLNKFSDMAWLNPTDGDKALMKRGTSFFIEFAAFSSAAVDTKGRSLAGADAGELVLWHSGFGTAGVKTNNKTDDPAAVFNPYCKTLAGNIVGQYETKKPFAWDPVNKSEKLVMPVVGEFKIVYSSTLTERIRGIADWEKIFGIVMASMNVKKSVFDNYI